LYGVRKEIMLARIGGFKERRCMKSYPPSDVGPWGL